MLVASINFYCCMYLSVRPYQARREFMWVDPVRRFPDADAYSKEKESSKQCHIQVLGRLTEGRLPPADLFDKF